MMAVFVESGQSHRTKGEGGHNMTSDILNGEILGQSQVCKKQNWQDPA